MNIKVIFTKSPNLKKKLRASFIKDGYVIKKIDFGSSQYEDYTTHKDVDRKERYIKRHRRNENWKNPFSAGALSYYILWNKPTLKASISDYKKVFGFK